jgi:hypothetical protein
VRIIPRFGTCPVMQGLALHLPHECWSRDGRKARKIFNLVILKLNSNDKDQPLK